MARQIDKNTNTVDEWRKLTNKMSAAIDSNLGNARLYGQAWTPDAYFGTGDNANTVKLSGNESSNLSEGAFGANSWPAFTDDAILAETYNAPLTILTFNDTLANLGIDHWERRTGDGGGEAAGDIIYQGPYTPGGDFSDITWYANIISIKDPTGTPQYYLGGTGGEYDSSAEIKNYTKSFDSPADTASVSPGDFSLSVNEHIPYSPTTTVWINQRGYDGITVPDSTYGGEWEQLARPQRADQWDGWYLEWDYDDSPQATLNIKFVNDETQYNEMKVVRTDLSNVITYNTDFYLTDAEIAAGVNVVDWSQPPGSFERYGAKGTIGHDDSVAIQAAFDQNMQVGGADVISQGKSYILYNTVQWGDNTATKSNKTWYTNNAQLVTLTDINPLIIGTTTSSGSIPTIDDFDMIGGIRVQYVGPAGTSTNPGVILGNVIRSNIAIQMVRAFDDGIFIAPTSRNLIGDTDSLRGFSDNVLTINNIEECTNYHIRLSNSDDISFSGNYILGGTHYNTTSTLNAYIDVTGSATTPYYNKSNTWVSPIIASDSTPSIDDAIIDGGYANVWMSPNFYRLRGTIANSNLLLTSSSERCSVIGAVESLSSNTVVNAIVNDGQENNIISRKQLSFSDGNFAVDDSGQINTNQADGTATVGSQVDRMPIHDESGTLIGYIPIYAAS